MNKVECNICPHHCKLDENQVGACKARSNINGEVVPINYGMVSAIALDPIEKKPLRNFFPGSSILSVGSFGCNLKCSFCQNYEISMSGKNDIKYQFIKPEDLVRAAVDLKPEGNIGIAYTYNEPLVGYEYVRDCAILAKENNLKNVLVTNGCFFGEPINELLPLMDALNIDLKGFTEDFYNKIGGNFEIVKNFIKLAASTSHIEITTLIIPGENDNEDEMRNLSKFIASIDKNIPLHISRFFPCYKMKDAPATKISSVYKLADIAREALSYVYEGNC
ncbi:MULTISPECIES: AmmeMemoRadiSam system radical SAM enzyme [unclassified Sedimentibacter]|uniref:AmmeMemoRadiSam system radical SAM enzyme n=1 Tax=unclassified Sedimentibacter TaxID=2649220 RepID=UPI0027E180B9|nr:AmmeMemoRadiSam system radical SAM enzyme [Sedimentibacter sp. MB35-C1]WMJ76032.1 AmmeMemoRadiSam system radical SAM enzyme [Sedimentibacter sp. MB35-C1]